jgi:hypothetical protein
MVSEMASEKAIKSKPARIERLLKEIALIVWN